jgi:hypothetical protein
MAKQIIFPDAGFQLLEEFGGIHDSPLGVLSGLRTAQYKGGKAGRQGMGITLPAKLLE